MLTHACMRMLQAAEDKSVKWQTLAHNGVLFPPDYTPHGIKMLYNGQPVDLTPEQEEVWRPLACLAALCPSPPALSPATPPASCFPSAARLHRTSLVGCSSTAGFLAVVRLHLHW